MAKTLRNKLTGKGGRSRHSGTGRGGTRHSGKSQHSGHAAGARTGVGRRHTHKFTIGDPDAFCTLLEKNTKKLEGPQRERLLRAVNDATRRFKASTDKERDAFLHGLMTGYAVAFKLSAGEPARRASGEPGAPSTPPRDARFAAGGL